MQSSDIGTDQKVLLGVLKAWVSRCEQAPFEDCGYDENDLLLIVDAVLATEPLFILRGSDKTAPAAIRNWAHGANVAGAPGKKVADALNHAERFEAWQRANPERVKRPD